MEKLSETYFDDSVTPREHAIFELGIKLAAIFHLMMGTPVINDPEVVKSICEGIVSSISCQPFVARVDISLKPGQRGREFKYTKRHEFDYTSVNETNLVAEVEVKYSGWLAVGRVEWVSDLGYPLMYIKEIHQLSEN